MNVTINNMIAAAPSGVQDMVNMLDGMDEVHVDDLFTIAGELVRVFGMTDEDAEDEVEAQLEEYFLEKGVRVDSGCSEGGEQIYRTDD